MRLAIQILISAMMLITLVVASRSSSQRQGKQHHHSVKILKQQEQDIFQTGSWNNITTFPFGELDDRSLEPASKKKSTKKEWVRKNKRKHAALLSLAEKDKASRHHWLPTFPTSSLPERTHTGLECCPTVVELVKPNGAVNMDGHLVELFRRTDSDQRIYEHSCRPDVLDKPCRFVDKSYRALSRCVQQYSYTYAVVGTPEEASDWRLDYIRFRSGCACEILP